MKPSHLLLTVLISMFILGCKEQTVPSEALFNRELIERAAQRVSEYNQDETPETKVVKVVYFHGNDQAPLPAYSERLNRTLEDVSDYYAEELAKYGVQTKGIPFEKQNGKIVFHVVEGDDAALSYNKDSGGKIQNEIAQKTQGEIDLSKDHVLVINGLCYQQEDGTYVFHSPYYGTGSYTNGICFVADCPMLDVRYLNNTVERMVFSEMFVKRKECLVAEFNSWYIGGIAHEMGHFFGLPHDFGNPAELDKAHRSMMGQYGSRHYKDYLWQGKESSVFSSASVLQLLSHPLLTGKGHANTSPINFSPQSVEAVLNGERTVIKTSFQGKDQPYGVVALVRPTDQSEYFNRSYINVPTAETSVDVELNKLSKGNYNLSLLYLFPNGAVRWQNRLLEVDGDGEAQVLDFSNRTVEINALYTKLQGAKQTPAVQTKLEIVEDILHATPVDPRSYSGNSIYLSDAQWTKASVGWQKVARNYFSDESEALFFLQLHGKIYKKGLYAHSPSEYVFDLGGKWKSFSATIGLRDYAHNQGSARFIIVGDGKVLYTSRALRVNHLDSLLVDVSNVKTLELRTEGTEGHVHNSWAIWVDPILER